MSSSRPLPTAILQMLEIAHPSWQSILEHGLHAVTQNDPDYLAVLVADDYLPTAGRLFAAFQQPLEQVRYVLVGEGPYPRAQSATGVCFMDGAVESLWSENGLSKQVNRATSLRNFIKMLLVADGQLAPDQTTGVALAQIGLQAQALDFPMVQRLEQLQESLTQQGFLLLNASLVYRAHVKPAKEAKAWLPFLKVVLQALAGSAAQNQQAAMLVLWGKIAEVLNGLPETAHFPKAISEHPYNLSFITNPVMQRLFGPMHLLRRSV